MLLEKTGEITPERMKTQSQSKNNTQLWMWLVMEVKSNAVKNNAVKRSCEGPWNVRSMNQGKLEVVKQEMARVNIDILGISEQKWTEWMNLTQVTIIYTTVGKNLLEEME